MKLRMLLSEESYDNGMWSYWILYLTSNQYCHSIEIEFDTNTKFLVKNFQEINEDDINELAEEYDARVEYHWNYHIV